VARKRSAFTRWLIRSLVISMVFEAVFLLGGLKYMGLEIGDIPKKIAEVKKFTQNVRETQKIMSETMAIIKGDQGGLEAAIGKLGQDQTLESIGQLGREGDELNPFALPKGVHTLKELEAMARKSEEESSEPEGTQKAALKVTGIFLGRTQQTAIVGGILLQVGDLIGGEQVFAINREGVVLERDGNRRTLLPPALEGWMPAGEASPFPPLEKTNSSKQEDG